MASHISNGGASAPPTVLPFPERNKGRKRRSNSIEAMGLVAMMVAERDGDEIAASVQRFDRMDADLPSKSVELLFATLIWAVLTVEQQDRLRSRLRCMAYDGDRPSRHAVQLHNMLEGRR